jgi:transposase
MKIIVKLTFIYVCDIVSGRARSRVGTRAVILARSGDNANVTLIAAISPTAGLLYHEIFLGTTDGDRFANFISNLLLNIFMKQASRVIIMDNARIHHVGQVEDVIASCTVAHRLKYLPPYSPQLNPIELMFKKVKNYVTHQLSQTHDHLMTLIERGLRNVTASDCSGWHRECTRYYFKCIANEPLV